MASKQIETILIGAALAAGGLFLWTRMRTSGPMRAGAAYPGLRLQPGQTQYPGYGQYPSYGPGGVYRPGQAVPIDPVASLCSQLGSAALKWLGGSTGSSTSTPAPVSLGSAPNSVPDTTAGLYGDLNTYDASTATRAFDYAPAADLTSFID
jgi:hypothetical protein